MPGKLITPPLPLSALTEEQRLVLDCVAHGATYSRTGSLIGVSPKRVDRINQRVRMVLSSELGYEYVLSAEEVRLRYHYEINGFELPGVEI